MPPLRVRGVEVANGWDSVPLVSVFVGCCCEGVSMIPVIFSAYSSLVVDLGKLLLDRSKDKPALIMRNAVVGILLTLTFLLVGGPLSKSPVGGGRVLLSGLPELGARFLSIVMDLMSESALLPLQVIIGNESDDDLMMVNTRRSFVCCSRYRISARWPEASCVSLSL